MGLSMNMLMATTSNTPGVWTSMANIPTSRYRGSASVVGGKIYYMGGQTDVPVYLDTNEEYDPGTDTWATKASIGLGYRVNSTSSVYNNSIYLIGGHGATADNLNEEYTPLTNMWATKTAVPVNSSYATSQMVNSKIYVIGGITTSNKTYEYDPVGDSWALKTNMPTERFALASSMIGNKIYVVGGQGAFTGTNVSTNEMYDPALDTWYTKASMSNARAGLSASAISNDMYAIGGSAIGTVAGVINEQYDSLSDSWMTKAPATFATSFVAVTVGSSIYTLDHANLQRFTP